MVFFYPGACKTHQHGKDLNGWSIIRRCLKITICLYIGKKVAPLVHWGLILTHIAIWRKYMVTSQNTGMLETLYIISNMQICSSIVFGTNFYIGHSRAYVYPFVKCSSACHCPKTPKKEPPTGEGGFPFGTFPLGGGSLPYYTTPRKTPLKTNLYI